MACPAGAYRAPPPAATAVGVPAAPAAHHPRALQLPDGRDVLGDIRHHEVCAAGPYLWGRGGKAFGLRVRGNKRSTPRIRLQGSPCITDGGA